MLQQNNVERKAPTAVRYISVRNAEAVIGQNYRWCRDTARQLGVPIVAVGHKRLIDAQAFFAALEKQSAATTVAPPADPTASVLATLGLQVRQ